MMYHDTDVRAEREVTETPKEVVIPKGCKEYRFDASGFLNEHIYVFKCVARNEKNARRKFKNYQSSITK
jgi:hypothetical protein